MNWIMDMLFDELGLCKRVGCRVYLIIKMDSSLQLGYKENNNIK